VQVLVGRRGTVIIAPVSRRIGVKQEYVDLVSELAQTRRDLSRLRKKLGGRPLRIHREGFAQGFMQGSTGLFYDVARLHAQLRILLAGIDPDAPPGSPPVCRVCGEPWSAHPKPDHAWDTPPVGVPPGPSDS